MSNSFHEYRITKVADENQQKTNQVRREEEKGDDYGRCS